MFQKDDVIMGKVKYRNNVNVITLYDRQSRAYQTYPDVFVPVLKPRLKSKLKQPCQIAKEKLPIVETCKFNVESDIIVRYTRFQSLGNESSSPRLMYFYDSSAMSSMVIPKRLESHVKGVESGSTVLLRSVVKGNKNFVSTCWTNMLKIPANI